MSLIPGISTLTTFKYILYFLSVMFLVFIVWFIYLNRNGEKVVVSVLPVLGVLIATLVTVSSLRIEPRKIEFQTHFTFEDVTKKPLWIVDGSVFRTDQDTKAAYIIQHLAQNRPDQLQDGEKVYEEIAFRVIIEELSRIFSEHWDIKVMKVSLPDIALARSNTYPDAPKPAFVTWEKISERFMAHHGHGLALLDMVPFATDKKMAIPEGTEVSAQVDSPKRDFPQTTLLLENNFVRARISLSYNGGVRGIGYLKPLVSYPQEQEERFWTAQYATIISVELNPLVEGHPEMPRYRRWVETIVHELQDELDVQKHWERARESYLLSLGKPRR